MKNLRHLALSLTERGLVPDLLIRRGIRSLVRQRLQEIHAGDPSMAARLKADFIEHMRKAPTAPVPDKANEQHYEVPAGFFKMVLGPHMKYSSALWPVGARTLADAEAAALQETSRHAELEDGQSILELGCGWGSLTLWMGAQYPKSTITAVSNSSSQREHIMAQAAARGLDNVRVLTRDMNVFQAEPGQFDRVVSVEMFEHMRNWPGLFARVSHWLKPGGFFFMHVFVHRAVPYVFEDRGPSDWMSRYFFTGGMMPSDDLPLAFQDHLKVLHRWRWAGMHYEKTANAWLVNMDANRDALWPLFIETYGEADARTWWMRWRVFFMACAELFGYDEGRQWWVGHYLLERPVTT